MNDSAIKYKNLVDGIDTYIKSVRITPKTRTEFDALIKSAGRIFITGTGTSLPTAQYLSAKLQSLYPEKSIYFLVTAKAIRAADQLRSDDRMIVISYGLNRADSLIILKKAVERCKTITISGSNSITLENNLNIVVPPEEERIFCRPVSPLTTLVAIEQLCGGKTSPIQNMHIADSLAKDIDPSKQTIILYAADVSFAAELWGITLREGAGMNVSIKDMENYSHGYYGPDTKHLNERQYIILKSDSREDERDFSRAEGLYDLNGFTKYVVTASGGMYNANAALFREIPEIISRLLSRTGYDMYGPNGMDENRRYHEYEHYQNY